MSPKQFVVQPGDRSAALSVIGTSVTVLVSAAEGKSQQVTLQSGDEGTGPPPHSHDWDESFYVTQGQVQFTCAGKSTMCVAGTFVHVPAGVVHAFNYGPGGGEMLEITGTGSKAIQMFTALDREIPPGPPDVQKVVQVAGDHGVTFHI
ncbi:cupin domain-containing protein [Thioalkalivibrio nitratireducens]|uniref:cupin domain-containing protein n=1 Tax=Thioalkalivibrio nitratireducens TaxID=186931 RepID=UPI0009F85CAC|nr:cupin domain-containing protein [Thioalkalivibrio nitratireducens]